MVDCVVTTAWMSAICEAGDELPLYWLRRVGLCCTDPISCDPSTHSIRSNLLQLLWLVFTGSEYATDDSG